MEEQHWLLPFTYGVNAQAISVALRLAYALDAAVIALSLIPSNAAGIRAGRIEQSQDFLEVVRWQAEQLHVAIKCHEVITSDVQQSIKTMAQEWCCTGVAVVVNEHKSMLLDYQELCDLLAQPPTSVVLLRLPTQNKGIPSLLKNNATSRKEAQEWQEHGFWWWKTMSRYAIYLGAILKRATIT